MTEIKPGDCITEDDPCRLVCIECGPGSYCHLMDGETHECESANWRYTAHWTIKTLRRALSAAEQEIERLNDDDLEFAVVCTECDHEGMVSAQRGSSVEYEWDKLRALLAAAEAREREQATELTRLSKGWLRVKMSDDEFCALFAGEQLKDRAEQAEAENAKLKRGWDQANEIAAQYETERNAARAVIAVVTKALEIVKPDFRGDVLEVAHIRFVQQIRRALTTDTTDPDCLVVDEGGVVAIYERDDSTEACEDGCPKYEDNGKHIIESCLDCDLLPDDKWRADPRTDSTEGDAE